MISYVQVSVATLWTGPDAPREVDAAATADEPDVQRWAESLDADARAGLHGRTLSQLLRGEPVDIVGDHEGWVEAIARWQPSRRHERGYPGWLRRAHVSGTPAADVAEPRLPADVDGYVAEEVLETARTLLGVGYVWGGTCPQAVDCSGLVHWALREHGVMVPRDAHDQRDAATEVFLGEERTGDLYFFARPEQEVHHVGFVVRPGVMLHASESGSAVVEEPLDEQRRATLVAAGRF